MQHSEHLLHERLHAPDENPRLLRCQGSHHQLYPVAGGALLQGGHPGKRHRPGFFSTKQNAALLFNPDGTPTARTGKILAATPMGRFGDSEKELAGAVLFLLNNEAASFITGVCIPIDGGFSAYSGV